MVNLLLHPVGGQPDGAKDDAVDSDSRQLLTGGSAATGSTSSEVCTAFVLPAT